MDGLSLATREPFDAIILDRMLPGGLDGLRVLETLRAQATERFCRHIERWLENTGKRLHGSEPIPRISAWSAPEPEMIEPVPVEEAAVEPRIAPASNAA